MTPIGTAAVALIKVIRAADDEVLRIARQDDHIPLATITEIRRFLASGRVGVESIALDNRVDLDEALKPVPVEPEFDADWHHCEIVLGDTAIALKATDEAVRRICDAIAYGEHSERKECLQDRLVRAQLALAEAKLAERESEKPAKSAAGDVTIVIESQAEYDAAVLARYRAV